MRPSSHPLYDIIAEHAGSSDLSKFEMLRLGRIQACHEQTLGTHALQCNSCGTVHIVANTCKSLHCPSCSHIKTQNWMAARIDELVDCRYFHNVFTLPHHFNDLFRNNFKVMANMLFKAVSETINSFSGRNKEKNKPGFMLFLHTWDQRLNLHFHIHAVLAGGWLDKNGIWKDGTRGHKNDFLFPVRALSKVFRGKFIQLFNEAYDAGAICWMECLSRAQFLHALPDEWVIYSKTTDGKTEKVIQYLARYTHRTGLAKSRLEYNGETVSIIYKDRKTGEKHKEILKPEAFLKRFCQHMFKSGVQRVRYYGFLGNAAKSKSLEAIRAQIGGVRTKIKKTLPTCGNCKGSSFSLIGIDWRPAPLLRDKNRRPRGPPNCIFESAIARPSFVDSQNLYIGNDGPRARGTKNLYAQ